MGHNNSITITLSYERGQRRKFAGRIYSPDRTQAASFNLLLRFTKENEILYRIYIAEYERQVAIEWRDFAQIAEQGWRPAPAFAEAAERSVPRAGAGSRYGAVIQCGEAAQKVPADGGNFLPG